jgi:uncharacterized RDD family membrane protein YckC
MLLVMNATAQASPAPVTGPKLDNRRVFAAIVDVAIVVAGALVILFAADALSGDRGDVRGALSAVILGWALYYYFALESGDGQTVGKKVMKLRVVRADGRPAGMREIAVRTVLRVVDGVGGYIVGLIVMLATGQRRQRLGDLAAGTIVVDASVPAYTPPAPVVQPIEEASAEDAPVEDEPEPEIASYMDTPTITLPSRPAPPATLEDLAEPAADVEDEPAAEVEDEPAAEEPLPDVSTPSLQELAHDVVAAQEPVPVVAVEVEAPEDEVEAHEDEDEPVDDQPVDDQPVEDEPVEDQPIEDQPVEDQPVEDEPVEAEPMTLKSVETVSAIDLVMGGASEEDASSEQDHDPEPPAAS